MPQTDVAYVTRFGKVLEPQQGALLPGLHLKLPFVVQADLISITTDTFELPQKKAFTKDTQQLTLFAPQASRRPH